MEMLKSFLHKTFYKLSKLQYIEQNLRLTRLPKNMIVEFIGPSGVGKTTLFKEFEKHASIPFENISRLNILLTSAKDEIKNDFIKNYHIEILKRKIISLFNEDCSNKVKLECLNDLTMHIYNDIISLNVEGCIVFDEGIFHNFCHEFIELFYCNIDLFNLSLNNRVFVNITGEPEKIYGQIMDRRNKLGLLLPGHENNKEIVLEMVKNEISERKKLIDLIKAKRPCLELDITNALYVNVGLIDAFLKTQKERNI